MASMLIVSPAVICIAFMFLSVKHRAKDNRIGNLRLLVSFNSADFTAFLRFLSIIKIKFCIFDAGRIKESTWYFVVRSGGLTTQQMYIRVRQQTRESKTDWIGRHVLTENCGVYQIVISTWCLSIIVFVSRS